MAAVGLGLGAGALWWWAVVRLAVAPDAGVLEGAVAAGGWGLSLLPVHCVAKARAAGAVADGRWRGAWRTDTARHVGTAGSVRAAGTVRTAGTAEGATGERGGSDVRRA
ncbi:hypothetical protein QFZ56_005631 [Streptomyces achromogenes]|uniref:Uncharacterized protein n=1 Tax=Streptomyces achromogenes TaxID=67255 RepID=A0ABU0QA61_STRAH|nr:hypothetical protein [Streptomyces achromogenes]MDQ0686668.1 hypothetical protein [Streptomyces achromogenes]